MASSDATTLDLDECVPLGHAFVARVAEGAGVRLLAIKGPTLTALGLRPPRRSLDVDVLVSPEDSARLIRALAREGWKPSSSASPQGVVLPPHSQTVAHDGWPVEIDVHHYFPGFSGDPQQVFDVLWRDRIQIDLAGQLVASPSRAGAAAIALLHLLRSGRRRSLELDDLVRDLDASMVAIDREKLGQLAHETGSAVPLAEVLPRLHIETPSPQDGNPADPAWELSRRAGGARTLGWIIAFREAPVRRWPTLAWRAVWLSEAELRVRYPAARPGWRGLCRMWMDRWVAGFSALPHAVRLLRDERHRHKAIATDRTGD